MIGARAWWAATVLNVVLLVLNIGFVSWGSVQVFSAFSASCSAFALGMLALTRMTGRVEA